MFATYFIPRENKAAFLSKIEKIAKRAGKIGVTPVTAVSVKTLSLSRTRYKTKYIDGHPTYEPYVVSVEHVAYTVEGAAPKVAGWEFVGSIEHIDGVNMASASPSSISSPSSPSPPQPSRTSVGRAGARRAMRAGIAPRIASSPRSSHVSSQRTKSKP